ncbi:MAG TPA: agmatinase, partial [Candidatus Bathyarchaeota archaeon]|nr:agmatinase [Candidatus Bathyarchaeota archaeon]
MTYYELYVSQSNVFSGFQTAFEKANYVVVGIPFDATSTFRAAARFAPNAIREASLNIETYSFHSEIDVEDLAVHDLGDLHVSADIEETLRRAKLVVQDLLKAGKTPVILGGEHTVTLGCFQGLGSRTSETAVVSLDAHLDLRDEYLGLKTSHTTFMRRLNEQAKPAKIIEIGTRAVCRQELEYADEADVKFFTTSEIRKLGTQRVIKKVESEVEDFSNVY